MTAAATLRAAGLRAAGPIAAALLLALAPPAATGSGGRPAPEWEVSEWVVGPAVTLGELRGRVVVVEFFQLWCPGCQAFSIPLMKRWHRTFAPAIEGGDLVLVSLHTVFEGHGYQTPARLRTFVAEHGIRHRVGVDRHRPGERVPETMKRYRTRGTPELAVIDRRGVVRFQRFGGFDPAQGEAVIRALLAER